LAFQVRIFHYRGLSQLPQTLPKQYTADTVFTDTEPYEARDILTTNGLTPVSTAPLAAPDQTAYIRVEVPDGQSIRYEINPANRTGGLVSASSNSPILSGINRFQFFQGWSLSLIDAAGT